MAAGIAEELAHGAARIRGDVLHGSGVRGSGGDDDSVIHGAELLEGLDDLSDGGAFLADGDVDANDVAAFLIDDGVEGDGSLSGLAVADEQFALAAANRDHCVDGLDAGLQRLLHGHAVDHAGRDALDGTKPGGGDGAFAVDRRAEGIDDAANHCIAYRNGHDAAGAANRIAFLDTEVIAKQHRAYLVFLEIEGEADNLIPEVD